MTTEERLQNVEQELSRVRRRNRWLSRAVMLCLGIGIVFGTFRAAATAQDGTHWWEKYPIVQGPAATAQPAGGILKEVRANKFILVDADGNMLAQLGVNVLGPSLELYDDEGNPRVVLGADEDVSGLSLFDDKGKMRAWLVVRESGQTLSLSDDKGNTHVALTVSEFGPGLQLYDKGEMRAGLNVFEDGPRLQLFDEKGKGRCTIGAAATIHEDGRKTTYPESSIWLFGPDGKGLWSAPQ